MGYKIRECREAIGMSQEELAAKSLVSRTIISGLETGSIKTTTTETLLKIARALDKKVSEERKGFMNFYQHFQRVIMCWMMSY